MEQIGRLHGSLNLEAAAKTLSQINDIYYEYFSYTLCICRFV